MATITQAIADPRNVGIVRYLEAVKSVFDTNTTDIITNTTNITINTTNIATNAAELADHENRIATLETGGGGADSLASAYNFGGAGLGRSITVNNGAVSLVNGQTSGTVLSITSNAVTAASTITGLKIDMSGAVTNGVLVQGLEVVGNKTTIAKSATTGLMMLKAKASLSKTLGLLVRNKSAVAGSIMSIGWDQTNNYEETSGTNVLTGTTHMLTLDGQTNVDAATNNVEFVGERILIPATTNASTYGIYIDSLQRGGSAFGINVAPSTGVAASGAKITIGANSIGYGANITHNGTSAGSTSIAMRLSGAAQSTGLEVASGASLAVSNADEGRLRYNLATQTFQVSLNTAAYVNLITTTTSGSTLDGAYDFGGAGAGRTINATDGATVITSSAADDNDVFQITKTPPGIHAGNGIVVTMGSSSTGYAINIDQQADRGSTIINILESATAVTNGGCTGFAFTRQATYSTNQTISNPGLYLFNNPTQYNGGTLTLNGEVATIINQPQINNASVALSGNVMSIRHQPTAFGAGSGPDTTNGLFIYMSSPLLNVSPGGGHAIYVSMNSPNNGSVLKAVTKCDDGGGTPCVLIDVNATGVNASNGGTKGIVVQRDLTFSGACTVSNPYIEINSLVKANGNLTLSSALLNIVHAPLTPIAGTVIDTCTGQVITMTPISSAAVRGQTIVMGALTSNAGHAATFDWRSAAGTGATNGIVNIIHGASVSGTAAIIGFNVDLATNGGTTDVARTGIRVRTPSGMATPGNRIAFDIDSQIKWTTGGDGAANLSGPTDADFLIKSGQPSGTASGRAINLTASTGSTTGAGGGIFMTAGAAAAASGAQAGGAITMTTGAGASAAGAGNGGDITPTFGIGAGGGRTGRWEGGRYVYRQLQLLDYSETVNVIGNATGAKTIDIALGSVVTATSTGDTTWTYSNPPTSGQAGSFTLILTNGGAHTQTWPVTVAWPGYVAPTLTTSGVDVLVFVTIDAGTTWRGALTMLDSGIPA